MAAGRALGETSGRPALSERDDEIRATAEDVKADAAKLRDIEDAKANLDPDDPRTAELAREAERLARRIIPKVVAERELQDSVADEG
jgi:hypothetical protein